ncbi:MAG: penicillin-binding protein 2, partial [Alistipes sp.]|nr:penicillin-binding protein 2 [Alistipes sp.]
IFSRDDEPLAISIFRYQPLLDFDSEGFLDTLRFQKQADSLSKLLSAYFGDRSSAEYYNRLNNRLRYARSHFDSLAERRTVIYRDEQGVLPLMFYLAMGFGADTVTVVDTIRAHRPVPLFPRDVDYSEWEQLRRYPILNYNLGMTYRLDKQDRRIYPQGDLARRTIGRINPLNERGYGLDSLYAPLLNGERGFEVRQRIARGFSTRVLDSAYREVVNGADLITTLDLNIQDVADKALRAQLETENATWGTTLVMDVKTGDILAMANLGRSGEGKPYTERENYALEYAMEPGSTFKLATVLALLDDVGMSPNQTFQTNNGEYVDIGPAKKIRDSHYGDHEIALKRAVAGSSNVYFAKAIWEYYGETRKRQQFSDYLHNRLGLGETVGLEALGERAPQLTTDWRVADPNIMLVKMAYGYRVQMTPIQMLTFYNAIANGGRKIAPVLVKEIRRDGEVLERFETHTLREKICSDSTLRIVRECLEAVASSGTAAGYLGDTLRLRVAAKTGTAQVTSGPAGGYLGSMVAYFPADKPRYTILTTIETRLQPGKAYYGASLAGPVVERVVDYIYAREADWAKRLRSEGEEHHPRRIKGGMIKAVERVADRLSPRVAVEEKGLWGCAATDSLDKV